MELDLIDKKILYLLDQNARESISKIAKKLKIGRNVALYRINRLKEKRIIKGFFAEINNPSIGYLSFRVFLKLSNITKMMQDQLLDYIEKNPNIMWLSRVLGKWDVDLVFMTKNIADFEFFKDDLISKYNQVIDNYNISLLSRIYRYPKNYLLEEKRQNIEPTILDIKNQNNYHPDEKDEKILYELTKDATINLADLSYKIRLSINTIKKKIKNLENKKVILGYRIFLDPEKIGYEYYKLHINLKNYKEIDLKKFRDWLSSKNFVIYTDHYLNGEDFEIELNLRKESEYLAFVDDLISEFGEIIKEYSLIKFYDTRIFRYLPKKI